MAFYPASSSSPRQLSLDLDLDDAPSAHSADSGVKRSVIFPKNIQIFNVPEFQRQVSQLFDPLNINIEFRVTRQNRLEMRWSFPQDAGFIFCWFQPLGISAWPLAAIARR